MGARQRGTNQQDRLDKRTIVTRRPSDRFRHSESHVSITAPDERPPDVGVISCGDLLLDLDAHQAFTDGRPIHLSHRQFSVLRTLVWRAGVVVPTDELRDAAAADGGPSTANTVRTAISQLRARIGRGGRRPSIEVVRSRGYLVVAPAD